MSTNKVSIEGDGNTIHQSNKDSKGNNLWTYIVGAVSIIGVIFAILWHYDIL